MRPYTAASARTKAAASPASEDHDLLLECCVCRESTAIADRRVLLPSTRPPLREGFQPPTALGNEVW